MIKTLFINDPINNPFNEWLKRNGVWVAVSVAVIILIIVAVLLLLSLKKKQ